MSVRFFPSVWLYLASCAAALCVHPVRALELEWVTVGDPGNPPDTTGHGAAATPFQISKHEITVGHHVEFLNAIAAQSDAHGLWNGAYDIARQGGLAVHAPGAKVWIPTEDEWYKAAYPTRSHHGQDSGKIAQLAVLERDLLLEWGRFIGRMKTSRDGAGRLLDHTMSVFGAGMGNASSHDSTNLPVLLAGGRFRHGQHLAHDPKNPPPLCNLWVQMLQELGVPAERFGSSNRQTLSGLSI